MEDKALPFAILQRLPKTDVHKHRSIERFLGRQFDDVNREFQLLFLEERHHVIDKDVEMGFSVAEWNDNGDSVTSKARRRTIKSAGKHVPRVLFFLEILRRFVDSHHADEIRRSFRTNGRESVAANKGRGPIR